MKTLRICCGDIFRFSSCHESWGYGQVLLSDITQYIVVFEPAFRFEERISDVIKSKALLSGWTSDSKIYWGDWEIIGRERVIDFTFPIYKVEISGRTWITDVNANPIRLAKREEADTLYFHTSFSPVEFEEAFNAHHGWLPWEAGFEELLVR